MNFEEDDTNLGIYELGRNFGETEDFCFVNNHHGIAIFGMFMGNLFWGFLYLRTLPQIELFLYYSAVGENLVSGIALMDVAVLNC